MFLCCYVPLQVRITAVNKVRNYISYAMALLEEKGHSSVVLKGMGKAINKTVVVGE
jgi:DNA-binding protein